jgi:adenylyltransferase/sulfurtransferase
MEFTDDQLLQYSRQIMLPSFGIEGQQALQQSHVLIIGAGGLGSPAALYLAAAGVGTLTIADDDHVDRSNLQRQILHSQSDLGRPKVESARDRLQAINPDCRVIAIPQRLEKLMLEQEVKEADLVIDGSDNFATRFAVNAACFALGKPLVSGAAIRMEGQVSVFDPRQSSSPCYRCLYRDGEEQQETCAENGVLAPVVGIIGSLQALEAIKLLTGTGEAMIGRVMLFDGNHMEFRTLKLKRDPGCPVCQQRTN